MNWNFLDFLVFIEEKSNLATIVHACVLYLQDAVEIASKSVQFISRCFGENAANFVNFHSSAFVHQDLLI